MTIDEAIEDFKTMAKNARNDIIDSDDIEPQEKHYNSQLELYAKEKEQIAEWLEELKALREKNETLKALYEDARKEGNSLLKHERNKAIDDAMVASAKSICVGCGYLDGIKCKYKGGNCGVSKPMLEVVVKALEQLKAGGKNE